MRPRKIYHRIFRTAVVLILASSFSETLSQNLESIGNGDLLNISGSINATMIGYLVSGIPKRRDPSNYFLSGNLNLSAYGWSVPFSFSYSNQNKSFRQPFNQYGISPTYKWAKAYIGYHSLTYSSYSLSGHIFLGGAIELTPGKWNINVMYGRLNKAVEVDSSSFTLPSYRQMGFAAKVGHGDSNNGIDLVIFHAKDDTTSITAISDSIGIQPMENLVLSLTGRKKIAKRISIMGEWATSALTRDLRSEVNIDPTSSFFNKLFNNRSSTEYFQAAKTSIGYSGNKFNTNINYERVDPGYRTLGAYFFNNDIENISIGGATRLWNDKIDLSIQLGKQRNNLDDTEVTGMKRTIASLQINITPSENWNLNSSYSNFTSFTNVRPRFDPFFQNDLDTLNFYQISQTFSSAMAYNFDGTKNIKQGLFLTGNYQRGREASNQEGSNAGSDTDFYTLNFVYRYTEINKGWGMAISFNLMQSMIDTLTSKTWGPNLIYTRSLLEKKLRTNFSIGLNRATDLQTSSSVLAARTNASYSVRKKHQFSLSAIWLNKAGKEEIGQAFSEFTCTLNYTYAF